MPEEVESAISTLLELSAKTEKRLKKYRLMMTSEMVKDEQRGREALEALRKFRDGELT